MNSSYRPPAESRGRPKTIASITAFLLAVSVAVAALPALGQTKTVVVLVDLSDSTHKHRDDYVKYFKVILDHLHPGDTLLVSKIIKHPTASPEVAIDPLQLPAVSVLDNERIMRVRARRGATQALDAFAELVRVMDNETPILEVIAATPRLFAKFPAERKVLVILSDMMEHTRAGPSFESRAEPFNQARADVLFERLRSQRQIPVLEGVRVYVAGARDADARRWAAVRSFWLRYLQAARAELIDYGQALLKFDECPMDRQCKPYFQKDAHLAPVKSEK
jgi:hypothetical protein